MTGLGETLRRAREQAGLSLDDVEEMTRIRRKHVEALEGDDFASLPDSVYVKGFVKSYASVLGLDPQDLMELLPLSEPRLEMKPVASLEKPRRGFGVLVFAFLFVCVIGGLSIYLYNYYQNGSAGAPPPEVSLVLPTSTAPPVTATAGISTATTVPRVNGVEVRVRAIDRAWMAMYVDGDSRAVYNGTMEIGETQTFTARERLYLHCGNAGGVDYTVNSERKGLLGRPGEVVRLEWSLPPTGTVPVVRTVAASERPFTNPDQPTAASTRVATPLAVAPAPVAPTANPTTPRPMPSPTR